MSEDFVEWVDIQSIIPYTRNARKHGKGVDKVAASIKEYGFKQPIVIDKDNVIVAGHARFEAAKMLKMDTVPVHRASNLSEYQIKAYRLADNRTHEESVWDASLLELELAELNDAGVDLSSTAFDVGELDAYLESCKQLENESAEIMPPLDPVTRFGDVWQLGTHRLVCGDSAHHKSYELLLGAGQVDMVYTDPPYNVSYSGKAGSIQNDTLSQSEFVTMLHDVFRHCYAACKKGTPVYVSYSEKETENFYRCLREAGFKQASNLIWLKNQLVLGRGDYHAQHEPIWYGWKPGETHKWYGGRKQTTIEKAKDLLPVSRLSERSYLLDWSDLHVIIEGDNLSVEAVESGVIREDKPQSSDLHPTMKPVALMERLIKNSSARGNIVLDAFGGSGTTLIACEQLGRSARLIELDPKYCDVIIMRWQALTGKQAIHADTGKPYKAQL